MPVYTPDKFKMKLELVPKHKNNAISPTLPYHFLPITSDFMLLGNKQLFVSQPKGASFKERVENNTTKENVTDSLLYPSFAGFTPTDAEESELFMTQDEADEAALYYLATKEYFCNDGRANDITKEPAMKYTSEYNYLVNVRFPLEPMTHTSVETFEKLHSAEEKLKSLEEAKETIMLVETKTPLLDMLQAKQETSDYIQFSKKPFLQKDPNGAVETAEFSEDNSLTQGKKIKDSYLDTMTTIPLNIVGTKDLDYTKFAFANTLQEHFNELNMEDSSKTQTVNLLKSQDVYLTLIPDEKFLAFMVHIDRLNGNRYSIEKFEETIQNVRLAMTAYDVSNNPLDTYTLDGMSWGTSGGVSSGPGGEGVNLVLENNGAFISNAIQLQKDFKAQGNYDTIKDNISYYHIVVTIECMKKDETYLQALKLNSIYFSELSEDISAINREIDREPISFSCTTDGKLVYGSVDKSFTFSTHKEIENNTGPEIEYYVFTFTIDKFSTIVGQSALLRDLDGVPFFYTNKNKYVMPIIDILRFHYFNKGKQSVIYDFQKPIPVYKSLNQAETVKPLADFFAVSQTRTLENGALSTYGMFTFYVKKSYYDAQIGVNEYNANDDYTILNNVKLSFKISYDEPSIGVKDYLTQPTQYISDRSTQSIRDNATATITTYENIRADNIVAYLPIDCKSTSRRFTLYIPYKIKASAISTKAKANEVRINEFEIAPDLSYAYADVFSYQARKVASIVLKALSSYIWSGNPYGSETFLKTKENEFPFVIRQGMKKFNSYKDYLNA